MLGAVLALATGAAAPASATIISYTFDSRITDGVDITGLFGTAGANLAGDAIEAVFTFDTSLGERGTVPGTTDSVIGGTQDPSAPVSPLVSASVTINKHTVSIGGGLLAAVLTNGGQFISAEAIQDTTTFVDAFVYEKDAPASLDTPFSPMGDIAGTFNITETDPMSGALESANASFALPEPATWAMMLMGFAGLGAALRGRRGAITAR
jgi:hypothetical protein